MYEIVLSALKKLSFVCSNILFFLFLLLHTNPENFSVFEFLRKNRRKTQKYVFPEVEDEQYFKKTSLYIIFDSFS